MLQIRHIVSSTLLRIVKESKIFAIIECPMAYILPYIIIAEKNSISYSNGLIGGAKTLRKISPEIILYYKVSTTSTLHEISILNKSTYKGIKIEETPNLMEFNDTILNIITSYGKKYMAISAKISAEGQFEKIILFLKNEFN